MIRSAQVAQSMWTLEDGVLVEIAPLPPLPKPKRKRGPISNVVRAAFAAAREHQRRERYRDLVDGLRDDVRAYRLLRCELERAAKGGR
jgi:hypothetical protein